MPFFADELMTYAVMQHVQHGLLHRVEIAVLIRHHLNAVGQHLAFGPVDSRRLGGFKFEERHQPPVIDDLGPSNRRVGADQANEDAEVFLVDAVFLLLVGVRV